MLIRSLTSSRCLDFRQQGFASADPRLTTVSSVRPIRLLLEAGILTSPAAAVWLWPAVRWPPGLWWLPWAGWHAVLNYGPLLATPSCWLSLRDDVRQLPSRLKQRLSEDLGIGYCGYVLREAFGIRDITDVQTLLGQQLQWRPGGRKRWPDFFGQGRQVVIAEAKGTIGDMRTLQPKMRQGKAQVGAVAPPRSWPCVRVVVGVALALESDQRWTIGAVWDPSNEDPVQVEWAPEDLLRQSYAKVLSFLGLVAHAAYVGGLPVERGLLEQELEGLVPLERNQARFRMIPWGPLGMVGISEAVLQALRGDPDQILRRVSDEVESVSPRDEERYIVLNNGVIWTAE